MTTPGTKEKLHRQLVLIQQLSYECLEKFCEDIDDIMRNQELTIQNTFSTCFVSINALLFVIRDLMHKSGSKKFEYEEMLEFLRKVQEKLPITPEHMEGS